MTEAQRVEIVLRVALAEPEQSEPPKPIVEVPVEPASIPPDIASDAPPHPVPLPLGGGEGDRRTGEGREAEPQQIPARMLNEFVYCQRLFYYEFVEGVFVESADTLRGGAIHKRVDSGTGAMPMASRRSETGKPKPEEKAVESDSEQNTSPRPSPQSVEGDAEPETIHSRSVQMGSERLGVVAKMDLVEVRAAPVGLLAGETPDLFTALEVCPVDYKAGAPREGEKANEL